MHAEPKPMESEQQAGVFTSVVCGISGSPESIEAARQATCIAGPRASLHLVTVVDPLPELWDAPPFAALETVDRLRARAQSALAAGRATSDAAGEIETSVVEGRPADVLPELASGRRGCLLALGAGGPRRRPGILRGGGLPDLLHRAGCSVLVARLSPDPESFPASAVVGVDGSDGSAAALAAADAIADRHGTAVWPLLALGGKDVDPEAAQRVAGAREVAVDRRAPVDALTGTDADLIVVGCRGLHRLAALGSVSERVALRAPQSVLVVKQA